IPGKDISVLINQISEVPRITIRKHRKTPCNNIEPQFKDFGPRAGVDHANDATFIERIIHNTWADLINKAELEFAGCSFVGDLEPRNFFIEDMPQRICNLLSADLERAIHYKVHRTSEWNHSIGIHALKLFNHFVQFCSLRSTSVHVQA